MRTFIILITLCTSLTAMSQNEHPMHIAMVSVMVDDPAKAFKYYTEVLGFEEVMYQPEAYLAIVKSTTAADGPMLLLEPLQPGGIEIAKKFKEEIYNMGLPYMSFGAADIAKTVEELKAKGVVFKKDLTKTDWGYEAVFDDDNGNYLQLLQMN